MEEVIIDREYIESCLWDIERASKELREKLKTTDLESAGQAEAILDHAVKMVDWILNKKEDANVPF